MPDATAAASRALSKDEQLGLDKATSPTPKPKRSETFTGIPRTRLLTSPRSTTLHRPLLETSLLDGARTVTSKYLPERWSGEVLVSGLCARLDSCRATDVRHCRRFNYSNVNYPPALPRRWHYTQSGLPTETGRIRSSLPRSTHEHLPMPGLQTMAYREGAARLKQPPAQERAADFNPGCCLEAGESDTPLQRIAERLLSPVTRRRNTASDLSPVSLWDRPTARRRVWR